MHTVRVWDLPTRLFHWLLLLCVIGLVITGNVGGNWMVWHFRLGYTLLSLLLFRLVWGFVGGHWSRFVHFVPSPQALWRYLRPPAVGAVRPVGHSPLGALSVIALLSVLLLQAVSGLFSDDEIAFFGPLATRVSAEVVGLATWYHKAVGKPLLIALIVLHLLAIAFYRWFRRERLVRAMITGDKIHPDDAPHAEDTPRRWWLALGVWALCGGVVFALIQWGEAGGF